MEIDYHTQAKTRASPLAGDVAVAAPLDGVYSLDDFLSTHQAGHDAHVAAPEAAKVWPAMKSKTGTSSVSPQPVAVGARSSKYTVLLYEKHQALAIPQPVFTFGGSSDTRWTVEVSFPGLANAEELQGLKEEGRFNSKQEAKEAMSKTALAILERLVQVGQITPAGKAKKKKGEPAQQQLKEKERPSENYVGQLSEFQRSRSAPQPVYTDYQVGTRWTCLAEIEGNSAPFGSLDALFGSKKIARQYAAGCAVSHFKSQGLWPEEFTEVGGIRKRKILPAVPSSSITSSPSGQNASVALSSPGVASASQQVASLALMLNLGTPEWCFTHEDPTVPDMHTVSCSFKNSGVHEGPFGEVRNIFGKKRAKEECARLTLQYLVELKEKREEFGRRMMADVNRRESTTGVIENATLGKKQVTEMHVQREPRISDGELDIYEDAMEH